MKRDHLHGRWVPSVGVGVYRYMHRIPFWRAVHREGIALGTDEGGSSYQVGRDLYVQAHDGTDYYTFVVPFHFATNHPAREEAIRISKQTEKQMGLAL